MVIKHKNIFKQESAWSNADELLLCLDTGSWRTERPVLDKEKCNYCGLCALYCPPQCMKDMGDHFEANLDFCKGCGICAKECPRNAIAMVPEGEFADEGSKRSG
jgi:2-oxoacid:acceptor oxidoreductase delta subunit (pyruvate/2-ketoisovalerate family)